MFISDEYYKDANNKPFSGLLQRVPAAAQSVQRLSGNLLRTNNHNNSSSDVCLRAQMSYTVYSYLWAATSTMHSLSSELPSTMRPNDNHHHHYGATSY